MDEDRKIKAAIAGVMYFMGTKEATGRMEPMVQTIMPSPWALNGRQTIIQNRSLIQRRVLKRN
jgi:hypothetical protein